MKLKKMIYLAILVSLGLALHIIEGFIPNPFVGLAPGAKLGLANIIGLITLVILGLKSALTVNILRSFLGGLATGAVTSMFYSMAGAFLSTLAMWFIYKYFKRQFSLIGVSVFGALAHNIAQLLVAALIINNIRIFIYLPILMFASILTGIFIGLTSHLTLSKIKNTVTVNLTKYS